MNRFGSGSAIAAVAVCLMWPGAEGARAQETEQDTEQEAVQTQAASNPEAPLTVLEAWPVPAPEPPPLALSLGGRDYTIGRQDLLEVRVFELEELDQTVRVSDDGYITLPLLGRLAVAGLTKNELESLIAQMLEERYVRDPQVTVFVKEFESRKVAVSGAVKKPDTYAMLGDKTLLEMISLAGGLDADMGTEIIVFRRGDGEEVRRLSVDLNRLVYEADPSLNLPLQPGDIVYVPVAEKIRLFVSGAVQKPGLYEVPRSEPVTVLKAITLAGGTTDRASEKRVQIIRTAANGSRISIPVDLRKVKKGKVEDPVLQRDDLVLVPESFF